MKRRIILSFLFFFLIVQLYPQQIRKIRPIRTPYRKVKGVYGNKRENLEGKPVKRIKNIPRGVVEKVMRKFANSWGTGALEKYISRDFYERDRLLDALSSRLPSDAKLRLLSVGDYRIIEQNIVEESGRRYLVSRVLVRAKTQIEYHNDAGQLITKPGEQEYQLKIKLKLKKLN